MDSVGARISFAEIRSRTLWKGLKTLFVILTKLTLRIYVDSFTINGLGYKE